MIYEEDVRLEVQHGEHASVETLQLSALKRGDCMPNGYKTPPVLQAWAEDDDLQELRLTSNSIGFVHTYSKKLK